MENSNIWIDQVAKESDKNKLQIFYSNSVQLPTSSSFDEGILRFKFSDENIRNAIMRNAFSILNNAWKNLVSDL